MAQLSVILSEKIGSPFADCMGDYAIARVPLALTPLAMEG